MPNTLFTVDSNFSSKIFSSSILFCDFFSKKNKRKETNKIKMAKEMIMTRLIFYKYTKTMETTQTQKKLRGHSRLKTQAIPVDRRKIRKAKNSNSLPDLISALVCFLAWQYLMFYTSPNDVANLLYANSYLPFVILIFFTVFFFLKFALKKVRLAFCLAFELLIMLVFHLQNLDFNYYWVIILTIPPFIWLIVNQIEKRLL